VEVERFERPGDRHALRSGLGLAPDDIVLGHVGRFIEAKNHRTIVRVAEKLRAELPNLRLLLVGDGPTRAGVERAIDRAGLAAAAVLPGARRDVPQMLACMDLFLLPSIYEGCPGALLEAMAAGVPFVASDIPAVAATVPPAAQGLLAAPRDVTGLADRALGLLRDEGRRTRLVRTAREHVRARFSVAGSLRSLLGIIEEDLALPA
jgi:glycosyltransferase involved in cell wall biosynthesis